MRGTFALPLDDRMMLAFTSLVMHAERMDGCLTDDSVLDASERWTVEPRDRFGCFTDSGDRATLLDMLWLATEPEDAPEGDA
jgi:hypothetical protein